MRVYVGRYNNSSCVDKILQSPFNSMALGYSLLSLCSIKHLWWKLFMCFRVDMSHSFEYVRRGFTYSGLIYRAVAILFCSFIPNRVLKPKLYLTILYILFTHVMVRISIIYLFIDNKAHTKHRPQLNHSILVYVYFNQVLILSVSGSMPIFY